MSHSLQLTDEIEAELIDSLGREAANQLLMIKDRLPELEAASSLRAACRRCAAEIPGLTEEALYCRMKRYKKTGNLLDLANRRGGSNLWSVQKRTLLPAAFKEFYRALREKHQRVATAAHDELVLIYRTRYDLEGKFYDRIPGFDGWPPANPLTGLPEGWTYKNLQKAVPDHPWDRAASRQGLAAASAFRPPVRTTRVGLRIGERVEFDDHQFDLKVHFAGQSRAMRPVCFGGVDGLSSFVSLAVRPTLWDDAAEQKRTLTEFQFRSFVLFWLSTHGYRDDDRGTTLVTERGTAVIREDFESRLRAFTGGRVKVSAGSMFSEASHPGHYAPRGKGNFRHKAAIEGFWGILENVLDRLPARMGSNQRLNGPAELHGREMVLARTLDLARVLPPEFAEQLLFPVLNFSTFSKLAYGALETLLADPDHNLEGWEELGFTRMEWRSDESSPVWLPQSALLQLPEPERLALSTRLATSEALSRCVRLSRGEVWQRHSGELKRLDPSAMCRLMNPEDAIEVTVSQQSLVEFQDQAKFGPGTYRFLAESRRRALYPGDKFLAYFNPLLPRWLQLVDSKGAPVAMLEAWEAPSRSDLEGVKRQMGRQAAWEAGRKSRLASRHFDEAEQRAHLAEHNRLVVEAAGKGQGGRGKDAEALARRAAEAGRAMIAAEEEPAEEGEVIDERITTAPRSEDTLEPDESIRIRIED